MKEKNTAAEPAEQDILISVCGSKKNGSAGRGKNDMKSCMEMLLSMPVSGDVLADIGIDPDSLPDKDKTNMLAVNAALLRAAMSGSVTAVKELRSIIRDDDYLTHKMKLEKEKLMLEKEKLRSDNSDTAEKLDRLLSIIGDSVL